MIQNSKLISIGNFDFKLNHLLIIGILCLAFSISFLIRSQAADYGFELNEFDPFFNYRATEYLIENGADSYYQWRDDLSLHPHGRNVSGTSQVMLHFTAATTYWLFGGNSSLYDFTILFPVVFSSLTAIVVFALVRVIGGTSAGLFAALLYSISVPILIRSPIGWFKSEPLGLFFGLLCVYLFLSGINSKNRKIAFSKIIGAGIITTFAISSWGGNQFFIIPLAIFIFALPFLRNDLKFLSWTIPLYTVTTLSSSLAFERGISFSSLSGIVLIISTIFFVACVIVQTKSKSHNTRNGLVFLVGFLIVGGGTLIVGLENDLLPLPSHRYLNAINPFLTTTDPLVDSVSEHATTTIAQSFLFNSILMIFSGLGVWLIIRNLQTKKINFMQNDMLAFSLIIGLIGVYVSSAFIRLELFASISVIILSSLGISILTKHFVNLSSESKFDFKKLIKFPFFVGLIFLLMLPLVYPPGGDAFSLTKSPPTILNGGTAYSNLVTNDWLDTLEWIKNNTHPDSVVASWWDYGYWIQTMSERATLVDNSTLDTRIIQNVARMLLSSPDEAWMKLNDLDADYVLIFVAHNKLNIDAPESYFTLTGGGDESKKVWFMRIAELDENRYLHSDLLSGTDHFWNDTLLGQMTPFSVIGYLDPNNISSQSQTYIPGMVGIYQKNVKFPSDGDGPLRLVYASPSFYDESTGPKLGVFVYEVNKDYVPIS